MRKKKKKNKHSVKSNKDVALEETINATAAYAQEQLCKVGEALAVLDSGRGGAEGMVGRLGRDRAEQGIAAGSRMVELGRRRKAEEEGGRFGGSCVVGQLGRGRGRRVAGSE
nr:hypothetical protein [Tanacetum cinerariifolium]